MESAGWDGTEVALCSCMKNETKSEVSNMTKTFKVERKGKQTWVAVRQMAHDPQYVVGSRIPGLGKVVEVRG